CLPRVRDARVPSPVAGSRGRNPRPFCKPSGQPGRSSVPGSVKQEDILRRSPARENGGRGLLLRRHASPSKSKNKLCVSNLGCQKILLNSPIFSNAWRKKVE